MNVGDSNYNWISAGMTDTVLSDLKQIKGVQAVTEEDRKNVLRELKLAQQGLFDEDTMMQVGKLTGADYIFTGSYLVLDKSIRVNAKLFNVNTGEAENSIKIDGALEDLFAVQDQVVINLLQETEKINEANLTPVKLNEEDISNIVDKQKPDPIAYELYSKGLAVNDTDPNQAVQYYEQASKIEPDYYEALSRTSAILIGMNHKNGANYKRLANSALEKRNQKKFAIKKERLKNKKLNKELSNLNPHKKSKNPISVHKMPKVKNPLSNNHSKVKMPEINNYKSSSHKVHVPNISSHKSHTPKIRTPKIHTPKIKIHSPSHKRRR